MPVSRRRRLLAAASRSGQRIQPPLPSRRRPATWTHADEHNDEYGHRPRERSRGGPARVITTARTALPTARGICAGAPGWTGVPGSGSARGAEEVAIAGSTNDHLTRSQTGPLAVARHRAGARCSCGLPHNENVRHSAAPAPSDSASAPAAVWGVLSVTCPVRVEASRAARPPPVVVLPRLTRAGACCLARDRATDADYRSSGRRGVSWGRH
jgi:hypothetical protein